MKNVRKHRRNFKLVENPRIPGAHYPGWIADRNSLAHYAANKAVAIKCRLRGDIQTAQLYEGIADGIYLKLPKHLQW